MTVQNSCRRSRLLLLMLFASLSILSETALGEGTIHGHIIGQDENGENAKLVSGAKVEFTKQGGGVFSAVTNGEGYYSIDELGSGTYSYQVTAENYLENGNGQSIKLKANSGEHVLDFFLTQGEIPEEIELGTLRGRVVYTVDNDPRPLEDAVIGIQSESGAVDALYANENGEYETKVRPGAWKLSATSFGFATQFSPTSVTVEADGTATLDFSLEKKTTEIPTSREVYALISVQQFDAPKPERVPKVVFLARTGGSEQEIVGQVSPLTDAKLAQLGLTQSESWLWFEAIPEEGVPAGEAHVLATLEPFDAASSDTQLVDPEVSTYFDLTLRKKTAQEIQVAQRAETVDESKARIHGHIIGQDEQGTPQELVPGVNVEFLDQNGLVIGTTKTNENGYYSIHSISPGNYVYRLNHSRYLPEDAGRGFTVTTESGVHVLDFFLTQGENHATIGTLAGTARDENNAQVPGTSVLVWQDDNPESKRVLDLRNKDSFNTPLSSGNWTVSATAPGYLSTPVVVTVKPNREVTAELILKKRSGPEENSLIEALVAVQRFDHKANATGSPKVIFARTSDEQFVAAKVRKLSAEEAAAVGGESGSWEWFIATPSRTLPAGDYFVKGELEDYEPATSSVQAVKPLGIVSYHITLRSQQMSDPETPEYASLIGKVQQSEDGELTPLADAVVTLHNTTTGTEAKLISDSAGMIESQALAPGNWWATVTAAGFQRYLHNESIELIAQRETSVEFTLQLSEINDPLQSSYAIVAIEKVDVAEGSGEPIVEFENINTREKIPGKLESIDAEIQEQLAESLGDGSSSWEWYDAFPSLKLNPGEYQVTARHDGFRTDTSPPQPIELDRSTVFNVTLRSNRFTPTPGTAVARVWIQYGANDRELADDAIVVFRNTENRNLVYAELTPDGNYVAELPAGQWEASAKVEGFDPSFLTESVTIHDGRQSFCELVIIAPPPEPDELPEALAYIVVASPAGIPELDELPEVHFVSSAGGEEPVPRRSETWSLRLYHEPDGQEELTSSEQLGDELPSWTMPVEGERPLAGGVGVLDITEPKVQAAAERAVALLNRSQPKTYHLDELRFCGSQALAGENFRLILDLSSGAGGAGRVSAETRRMTADELRLAGIPAQDLPPGIRWFVATPVEPLVPGIYHAESRLSGYNDANSADKSVIAGLLTTFDLVMQMDIPEATFAVYKAGSNEPLEGVRTRFINIDLGRSLSDAFSVFSDAQGKGSLRLMDGMGNYNVLLSGTDIKPQGRQVLVDQHQNHFKFEIRSTTSPLTFQGLVVKQLGATSMKTEVRTRSITKVINGIPRKISEEYTVQVPDTSQPVEEQVVANATILLVPADDGLISAQLRSPINSDQNGEFRRENVPLGQYEVFISAAGCLPYSGFVILDENYEESKFVLQPCNEELERSLVKLLTNGWGNADVHLSAADRHYTDARQADPQSPTLEYAMGLIMLQRNEAESATTFFENSIDMMTESMFWDRAVEAQLVIDMEQNQIANATDGIQFLGVNVYPLRKANAATIQTVTLLGTISGVLQGPWKQKYPQSGIEEIDANIQAALRSPHREAYLRGRDEVLKTHQQMARQIDQRQMQQNAAAIAQRNDDQQRINNRLKQIQDELTDINNQITRASGQSKALCDQNAAEAKKLEPALNRIRIELEKLQRQSDEYKRKLDQIKKRLAPRNQELPVFSRKGDQSPTRHMTVSFVANQNQVPGDLREQERFYQGELIKISRQIAALEASLKKYETEINRLNADCTQAVNRAKAIYRQLLVRLERLRAEQNQLKRAGAMNRQNPNTTTDFAEPENPLDEFQTFWDFDYNAGRRELLDQLANGCGGNVPSNAPIPR